MYKSFHCPLIPQVRPISSLSLTPVSIARAIPDSKQHAFPLGYSAHLHDSVGRLFDYVEISLSYRLNRFDIVQVTLQGRAMIATSSRLLNRAVSFSRYI